jgi:hypothetical protein
MIVCGMLFRPQPLEPVIGANDCASYLPTPWASANESRQTKLTPSQQDGTHGMSLQAKVMSEHFQATPTTSMMTPQDWVQAKYHSSKRPEYGKIIAEHFMPTPTTRDHKDTPGMALEGPDGRDRTDQLPRRVYKEHFLLTPIASDNKDRGKLSDPAVQRRIEKGKTIVLSQQVREYSQTCAGESPAPIGGMRLSLEFQCWFQGYPVDWLKPLLSASEILSSRKRGSQSPEPSPKN